MNSQDHPYFMRIVGEGADRYFDTRLERGLDRITAGIAAASPNAR